jgi:surfactin synthase thioesterase subunit
VTTLYCLPHAGGTPGVYRGWIKALAPEIDVVPHQHPQVIEGEQLSLTESAGAVADELDAEPYALFGHSLGAIVAFEAARALVGRGGPAPQRLFVCGSAVPPVEAARGRDLRLLPDEEFLDRVAELGGLPPEVTADAELRQEFLPGLRADYTLAETYEYVPGAPLPCPISAFRGRTDAHVDAAGLRRWQEFTDRDLVAREVPGGHFALEHSATFIHRAIRKDLQVTAHT